MTEDKNITHNIHEAIHREELSRPPMPKDLNARLMQRVEKEVISKPQPKRKRIIWPWVAAACAAAMIMVALQQAPQPLKGESSIAHVVEDSVMQDNAETKDRRSLVASVENEQQDNKVIQTTATVIFTPPVIKANMEEYEPKVTGQSEDSVKQELLLAEAEKPLNHTVSPKPRVLTERDIPITRPENLKYTKEELALMKRQANEAYIKWIELELEIARYNQEQTALK